MRSFDFYDTLFIRQVKHPEDIFLIVEYLTGEKGYCSARKISENEARKIFGGEVTFDEIAMVLLEKYPGYIKGIEKELILENDLLSPIFENVKLLTENDILVSDMYHSPDFFHSLLKKNNLSIDKDNIFISGHLKSNKYHGKLWHYLVKERKVKIDSHIGDNIISDVKRPKQYGIPTIHYTRSKLNRYEKEFGDGLDDSIISGVARACRLSSSLSNDTAGIASSVIAPAIYDFCQWIIDDLISNNIQSVYFLARDGQIPYQICSQIIKERNLSIYTSYIYASRQSLHCPSFISIEDAESWILENTPILTIGDISRRTNIDPDLIIELFKKYGFDLKPEQNIPESQRFRLKVIIRDQVFINSLKGISKDFLINISGYFIQEGLNNKNKIAIVDIGWNARMQKSIRNIIDIADLKIQQIYGYYFCLSQNHVSDSRDKAIGYLINNQQKQGKVFYDDFRGLLEYYFTADHPTTLAYSDDNGIYKPIFGVQHNEDKKSIISKQQHIYRDFMTKILYFEKLLGRKLIFNRKTIESNLKRFLTFPEYDEVRDFGNINIYEGQTEDRSSLVVQKIDFISIFKIPLSNIKWINGTLAYSKLNILLYAFVYLKRAKVLFSKVSA